MSNKASGKAYRKGISLKKLGKMFPDDDKAREWLEKQIWPDGPHCPHCGSFNVQCGIAHKTMTHRCRDCPNRPRFSLKMGTIMQASNLGYRDWAIAIYLLTTNLKSVSAMKLHRDLEISYTSAWHLAHRLREAFAGDAAAPFHGPAETDETYMGGKRKNMSKAKRAELKEEGAGRGTVGKTIVAGVKDRETGQIVARKVPGTDKPTLQAFVRENVEEGATFYTDEHGAYTGMPEYDHEAVNHSVGEYVRDMAHTNGIASFWSMLKRGYQGTFHHFSEKHMDRYIGEFAGRHNIREADTEDMMAAIARQGVGKRRRYADLIA
ncbi:MAG: IS1595 family transposase [Rhodospirillales bacterium]|nr:IS1595 family transposase [Rhodospirillales bacterium]